MRMAFLYRPASRQIASLARPVPLACLVLSGLLSAYWLFFRLPAPGIAVALLGAVAALMALRGEIRGREKILWIMVVFSLLVVEIRAIQKDRAEAAREQAIARATEIENFRKIGQGLTGEINESRRQFHTTMQSTDRLITNSTALETLAKKSIDDITGGSTFCYVMVGFAGDKFELVAIARGSSPLHDVIVEMTDSDVVNNRIATRIPLTWDAIQEFTQHFPVIPFLASSSGYRLGTIPAGAGNKRDLGFNFFCMNGTWHETLKLRLINGRWVQAMKVTEDLRANRKKTLYVAVPEDYPRVNGRVDW